MLRLERRAVQPPHLYVSVPLVAVGAALGFGALFLWANGFNPVLIYTEMARASFATHYGIEDSLVSATPLIFTGLAAALAFRFRLYNVGAEGQLVAGGICSAGAALAMGEALPGVVGVAVVLAAGMAGGAAWVAVPALARARLGTSEIITTLLLNYVAVLLARYLIFGSRSHVARSPATNFPQGRALPGSACCQSSAAPTSTGLLIGIACALLMFALVRWTRAGFDARVFGDSPAAARYAGISVAGVVLFLLLLSGAIAGLAGASEVAGRAHRLDPAASPSASANGHHRRSPGPLPSTRRGAGRDLRRRTVQRQHHAAESPGRRLSPSQSDGAPRRDPDLRAGQRDPRFLSAALAPDALLSNDVRAARRP